MIHCAFDHDFSNMVANCDKDWRAIEAMGSVLVGSDRPFVITSSIGMGTAAPGQPASEDHFNAEHRHPRKASELGSNAVLERGVNVSVARLPQVHDPVKQGLVSYRMARGVRGCGYASFQRAYAGKAEIGADGP